MKLNLAGLDPGRIVLLGDLYAGVVIMAAMATAGLQAGRLVRSGSSESGLVRGRSSKEQQARGQLWLNDGSCVRLRPEHANHVWMYDFVSAKTHDQLTFTTGVSGQTKNGHHGDDGDHGLNAGP
jgi:hypothetical protein